MILGRNGAPAGATQFVVPGTNAANASLTRTVDAVVGRVHYVTGFDISIGGATAGSLKLVTLAGLTGGTQTFVLAVPTGVALGSTLCVRFPQAIPSSAANTAVVLTVPALGAGSTNANANLYGYTF